MNKNKSSNNKVSKPVVSQKKNNDKSDNKNNITKQQPQKQKPQQQQQQKQPQQQIKANNKNKETTVTNTTSANKKVKLENNKKVIIKQDENVDLNRKKSINVVENKKPIKKVEEEKVQEEEEEELEELVDDVEDEEFDQEDGENDLSEEDKAMLKLAEEISELQDSIEKIEKKMASEILKAELEKDKMLSQVTGKRDALIASIPKFWYNVFNNHPMISSLLTGKDNELMSYLTSFKVECTDTPHTIVKFIFSFANNSLIKNKMICKEYKFDKDDVTTTSTKIQWKNGLDITKRADGEDASLFSWFDPEDDETEIFDTFKNDIWLQPLNYYESTSSEK